VGGHGAARSLFDLLFTFEVHCWGKDIPAVEVLRQALITAVRASTRRNATFNGAQWTTPAFADFGYVSTVNITARFTMLESAMPGDANPLNKTITQVTLDTSGSSLTDGIIQAGEG